MKVTFVIYSLGAGDAERAVTGLANYWSHEHDITIITLVKSYPFYTLSTNIQLKHCLNITHTKTNPLKSLKNAGIRIQRLIKHLKSEQPSIVISFMHTSNIYAIWACKWLNIPCIISERANHAVDTLTKIHERVRNFSYPYSSRLI